MKRFVSLLIAVVIVGIILGILLGTREYTITEDVAVLASIPQLSLEGFSRAEIGAEPEGLSILLTSGCKQLSMVTSQEQIYSIIMGLENNTGMRPLPHDLIRNMAAEFGIEVLMVKVGDMKDGTYYAKLLLKQGNKILNMDSRPSDAVALAARTGSPVYVKNELMENYGIYIC